MEEKKKSYSKKKKLALILLAITLVLASVGTFFYTAFAKDRPYKKSGSCTIKVGDATLPISVAFSGTENEFKTNGDIDKKRAFTKSSHTVRVSEGSITQGTAVKRQITLIVEQYQIVVAIDITLYYLTYLLHLRLIILYQGVLKQVDLLQEDFLDLFLEQVEKNPLQ